jgi:hypothetical protein
MPIGVISPSLNKEMDDDPVQASHRNLIIRIALPFKHRTTSRNKCFVNRDPGVVLGLDQSMCSCQLLWGLWQTCRSQDVTQPVNSGPRTSLGKQSSSYQFIKGQSIKQLGVWNIPAHYPEWFARCRQGVCLTDGRQRGTDDSLKRGRYPGGSLDGLARQVRQYMHVLQHTQ